LPFSLSSHVINNPLELIYSDVWGPAQTSVSGHNYYVSFVDAYSHFTWLYLIKRKSDVFDVFIQFQAHVERLLKHKIGIFVLVMFFIGMVLFPLQLACLYFFFIVLRLLYIS
jgi:hypothetical protein